MLNKFLIMDSAKKKDTSVQSDEETYIKNYTEAEAEEYLKYMNDKDRNSKEFNLDTFQESENDLQKLYIEDLAKVYRECNFTYKPQSNNTSILSMKDKILSIIETNSVVIIQGPTGCGKTTQVPQFILDANIKKRLNCNIIVTQPRRIAAISIAKRVCCEGGLGNLVGYQVGMQTRNFPETRLTYCTTEVLLQILIHNKHMLDYTHIILDEIHERDEHLDFLLLIVKKLLQTNSRQVKIILMSATIDVTKFAKYFSMRIENNLIPAPVVKISEKRNFNICTYYLDEIQNLGNIPEISVTQPKVTQSMLNFCSRIIEALDDVDNHINDNPNLSQRHSVLVFLPGIYEIEELHNQLLILHEDKLWDLTILHSLVSDDNEQHRIFQKPPKGYRRIILSTNIAESSITVPDVKYVIDFCLVKLLKYNSKTHYQSLQLSWASKANCIQRAGRTGRVMDGRVYRLVPKAFYDNTLLDYNQPEMLRVPLANVVLRAKVFDFDEPRVLLSHALDPPNLSNLSNTILSLKEIGALVDEDESYHLFDGKLTDLGKIMAYLPLDVRISKLIMLGHIFGVLRDTIILGASMSIKDIFSTEQNHSNVSSYATRKKWAHNSNSDCIATLNVYKMWQNERANRRLNTYQAERQWAQRNGFQAKTLRELDILINDITIRLQKVGITESIGVNKIIWQGVEHDFVLQVVLTGAFYPNYFVQHLQNQEIHKENITRTLGMFDPMKTIYLKNWPMKQSGYLYAKKFQEIFSKHLGIPEKRIAIFFNGSRVYIQFHEKETTMDESLQNISESVYQAIMMRKCNIPIEIKLLNVKEAIEKAKHHDFHKFERNFFFRKNFKKIENNDVQSKIRPKLPGLDVTCIPLLIQTIISPGYFWAILDDETTRKKLQVIEETLNEHPLKSFYSIPKILTVIAAPIGKDKSLTYHRAIIKEFISEVGELVEIFFIDYGRFSRIRFSDLREINNSAILDIPPLAFSCNLAFLRPSNRSNLRQWSEKSKNYFEAQIKNNKKMFGKIYSVVNSIVNLELIVMNEKEEQFNVNEALIEKGYAVKRKEGYLSNSNYELRMRINTMSIEEKLFFEEEQYDRHDLLEYPELPREKDCNYSVKLQGPYSPLEIELSQLTLNGKSKKIIVEMNSVNVVCLDNDFNQLKRLLICQSISESSTNSLLLRNTTFLPNIPGLTALLILIFAPSIELRCNSRKTYYTGALCGLSPINDCTNRGIFPEHDMEIEFDVEITMNDIKEINKLRHWMNIGMQLDKFINNDIIMCQNKVKDILLNLRDTRRKLRNLEDEEINHHSYQWNYYKKHSLPSIQKSVKKDNIYPLHKILELRETDEQTEEMLKHLLRLQHLAHEDPCKMKNVTAFCKLCETETFTLLQLRAHLCSKQHTENEKHLVKLIISRDKI